MSLLQCQRVNRPFHVPIMQAKFTSGSILRHVCTMTFASTAGLLSLFTVDFLDMYWLSLLGQMQYAAAIGYASSILFFTLSLSIGLSIGCAATVSHSVGEGDVDRTRKIVVHAMLTIVGITVPVMLVVFFNIDTLLQWLGAGEPARGYAAAYMSIVLLSYPLLALAMACAGIMRALGNAKHAMLLTLVGAIVNAVLDPLFIFGFGWDIEGAAAATALARAAMLAYGIWLLKANNNLLGLPDFSVYWRDLREYCQTAIPAVLTNLSTPVGVAYVTASMASYGTGAVAGWAIISKLQPLAFAGLFALSGSIGPIAGQNLGARNFSRILDTLKQSVNFTLVYCALACLVLLLFNRFIVSAFHASGDAAQLIRYFCYGLSTMFVFNGITFLTNALFNNLRAAHWATVFNVLKATVFTIPFVWFGAKIAGPVGILAGLYAGSALIAVLGIWAVLYKIRELPNKLKVKPS